MAKLPSAFNSEKHEDMTDFSVLPAGEYLCTVTDSDYKENSKQTGHYASLRFTIQNGPAEGRHIFVNLNLDNPNEKAVEIAQKELATICRAAGLVTIDETEDLHGIPVLVKVDIKKGKGDEPDQNVVRGYSQPEGIKKPPKPGDDAGSEEPSGSKRKPLFEDDED